jgi:UDP-GlcNAc:undecaprenyl-phosphate/decaprenyl-phosphate GlcNAc-1-phosphate transferase
VTPSIYSLFVLGALFCCVLTPLVRYFAIKYGFVDCPQRARKVHKDRVPRLGGAAILFSFVLVLFFGGLTVPELRNTLWGNSHVGGVVVLGSLSIFVIGVLDDLSRLSPKVKLLGEFVTAALVVWFAKLGFYDVQFLGFGDLSIPEWMGFGLACLWIVGMANAVNLIDGLDGLASGITLMGLTAIALVGYLASIPHVTWMATTLIGCILGFLVFNSRPASIFLGDCGSLTLGYLAGCLSLMGSFRGDGMIDGLFPVFAFFIPVADCVFAIVRRTLRGRSPFLADMEHFHHRLMARGLSHGKAVLALWAAALCCAFVAVGSAFGRGDQLTALLVTFGLAGFVLLRYLGYFRFDFFGKGLVSLVQDRETARVAEQVVKEVEGMVALSQDFGDLPQAIERASAALGFSEVKMSFFQEDGVLGATLDSSTRQVREVICWTDSQHPGYFPRDRAFSAEFPINGLRYVYGSVNYQFLDGRQSLEVHDEILLERIHDAISSLAGRVRRADAKA